MKQEWESAIDPRNPNIVVGGMICSMHFQKSDFYGKDKSRLKPGSTPSVFHEHQASDNCNECKLKGELIEKQKEQINCLRKRLRKAQNRAFYLNSTKKQLTHTLSELKEQNLIDEKLSKALQVQYLLTLLS